MLLYSLVFNLKNMTQIIAALVSILVIVLPWFGLNLATDELTPFIQGLVVVIAQIVVWYQRTTLQKSPMGRGDVGVLGLRRN